MSDTESNQATEKPKSLISGPWAFGIVIAPVVAITLIALVAIFNYDAGDAAAVTGSVVSALAGVGAAAFGVQLQAAAKTEATKTKQAADDIAEEARGVVEAAEQSGTSPDIEGVRKVERHLRRISR